MFCLSKEELEEVYQWVKMYIEYKKSKGFEEKLRHAFFKFGGKHKCVAWKEEDFFLDFDKLREFVEEHNIISISQTLLPNEIVLEADYDISGFKAKMIKDYLELLNLEYIPIFSGGSSVHFHVLFNRKLLSKEKKIIGEFFSKRVESFDENGLSTNHPWRLPGTYHPETAEKAIVVEVNDKLKRLVKEKNPELLAKFENNIDELLRRLGYLRDDKKKATKIRVKTIGDKGEGAYKKAFEELLNLDIEDGHYRVLILLTCLANKLKLSKDEFENVIMKWWERTWGKKESFIRNWIKYYEEKREWMVKYIFRLSWALKYYEQTKSDIREEDRSKIDEVVKKYFGKYLEKIAIKND